MKQTKIILLFAILLSATALKAQYWQQKVDYKINATLNDTLHSLSAFQEMTYTNHSPNSLNEIYILLYANAFSTKKSQFADQQRTTFKKEFIYFKDEDLGYMDSLDFKIDNKKANWNYEGETKEIVKITLPKPLLSGESVTISTAFFLKFPKAVSRLGHAGQSYQVTQWFPKAALYNHKGWHLLHYLDKGEFFADFGDYDVTLTLPQNYVVGATGNLQTPSEMAWLTKKSEEKINFPIQARMYKGNPDDFKGKPAKVQTKKDSPKTPSSKQLKTIRYTQKNVIDFAWFADKDYYVRKGSVKLPHSGRTVTTWSMFTYDFLSGFENSIEAIDSSLYYYSKFTGDYPFDNCTAVSGPMSAGGGMEYPTITIISVKNDVQQVIIHEVGHNWFQGILASNERRYAWMDEGINSFYDRRIGEILNTHKDFSPHSNHTHFEATNLNDKSLAPDGMKIMYRLMASKEYDQPLNLSSAHYCSVNYGGIVYGKGSYILEHLARYLGAEKFDKVMATYYEKWKFKHPYPQDLQDVFIKQTGDSLNWLFNDLVNTPRKNDYAIRKVKNKKSADSIFVTIKNKGKIPAPFTIGFVDKTGKYDYIWAEGFYGKKTIALPKQAYHKIGLNAEQSLFDVNMKNNFSKKLGFSPLKIKLGYTTKHAEKNSLLWLPIIGVNKHDGFMAGVMLYNLFLPKRRFEYLVAPMYGVRSNALAGFADLRLNFFPYSEKRRLKLQWGIKAKKYAYNKVDKQSLGFTKIEPSVRFEFRNKPLSGFNHNALSFRGIIINEEVATFSNGAFKYGNNPTSIHELKYEFERLKPLNNQSFKISLQHIDMVNTAEFITKVFAEYKIHIPYKWRNSGLNIRVFGGDVQKNIFKESTINRYDFGIGAGSYTDYTYDNTYFGRGATSGFSAAQIFIKDAGLKVPYNLQVSKLAALNLASSLPGRFPVKLYFDIALHKTSTTTFNNSFSGGIKFTAFNEGLEIYFPIINSSDIRAYQKLYDIKYYQQITFLIDFQKWDIFDIYKHAMNLL